MDTADHPCVSLCLGQPAQTAGGGPGGVGAGPRAETGIGGGRGRPSTE